MPYHVAGTINAVLFVLSLAGIGAQLARIWRRRQSAAASPDRPTAVLSLNYFSVSFVAYYAFFVYGYCIRPFNHYLVWPRLAGCLMLFAVLWEIARDRADRSSIAAVAIGLAMLSGGIGVLVLSPAGLIEGRAISQALSLIAAVLIAQSLVHQILLIRRSGHTGAVSPVLHVLTGTKDASTVAFGVTMGAAAGWPLVVMGASSAVLKVVLLYQFRRASRRRATLLRRGGAV